MANSDDDPTISSLLAMSEYFLHQTPHQVPEAVRCLMAALSRCPPPRIEAKARLQLGLVLYHHTNNISEARENLDRAALVAQSAANLQDVSFEASSLSVRILVEQGALHQAKSLLRAKLDTTTHYPYWHIRMLLQLTDVYVCERDENAVLTTLDRCLDYAGQINASYTRMLCLLYKGAFLLTHHHYREASEVLNITSNLLDGYQGSHDTLIRTFYLVVQVTHLLMAGQVKAAKPHLKQLQQKVKALGSESQTLSDQSDSSRQSPDNFQWLTKEQTFVLVYLVSVMHSVQGGYTDKAVTYAEKAMRFMPELGKDKGVVSILRAHLLEHTVSCLLMQGKTSSAVDKLHEAISVCHGHRQLLYSHRAVLHTLLGLYALATENIDKAISQFHTALQHTNESNLRTFISLNLAIAYLKSSEDRQSELSALMQSLDTDNVSCQSIKAATNYVQGLYMFTQLKLRDAKCHLRESLLLSNKNDMNKLTSCALVILGQIFLALGNTKETQDMAAPAMQLATKIPDKKLQVWAASLLADLYHTCGDYGNETSSREQLAAISREIQVDQSQALKSPHNSLVQWTVGEWPVSKPLKQKLPPSISTLPHSPIRTKHEHRGSKEKTTPASSSQERAKPLSHSVSHDALTSHDESRTKTQASGVHLKQERNKTDRQFMKYQNSTNGDPIMEMSSDSSQRSVDSPSGNRITGLKNMKLKLHDSIPLKIPSNSGSQSPIANSAGKRGSPLSIKTPEIRLARVSTPNTTPASSKTYTFPSTPLQDGHMDQSLAARMETTPSFRVQSATTPIDTTLFSRGQSTATPMETTPSSRGQSAVTPMETTPSRKSFGHGRIQVKEDESTNRHQQMSVQEEAYIGGSTCTPPAYGSDALPDRQGMNDGQSFGFQDVSRQNPTGSNSGSTHLNQRLVSQTTSSDIPYHSFGSPSNTGADLDMQTHQRIFNPQTNSGFNPQINSGFSPQANPGFNHQANPGGNPQANTGFNPQANSGFNPQANSGFNPQANSGVNPHDSHSHSSQQASPLSSPSKPFAQGAHSRHQGQDLFSNYNKPSSQLLDNISPQHSLVNPLLSAAQATPSVGSYPGAMVQQSHQLSPDHRRLIDQPNKRSPHTHPSPSPHQHPSQANLSPSPHPHPSQAHLSPSPHQHPSQANLSPSPHQNPSQAHLSPSPHPHPSQAHLSSAPHQHPSQALMSPSPHPRSSPSRYPHPSQSPHQSASSAGHLDGSTRQTPTQQHQRSLQFPSGSTPVANVFLPHSSIPSQAQSFSVPNMYNHQLLTSSPDKTTPRSHMSEASKSTPQPNVHGQAMLQQNLLQQQANPHSRTPNVSQPNVHGQAMLQQNLLQQQANPHSRTPNVSQPNVHGQAMLQQNLLQQQANPHSRTPNVSQPNVHGQAMLQQNLFQQQQQLLQARAVQQQYLNLQQQTPGVAQQTSMLSHSPYQLQGALPALYQQQMLTGLPQNLSSQQSPMHLTHISTLQKLSQEPNRSPIGGSPIVQGSVRMPTLHRYGAQSVHTPSLQLMNGANVQSGGLPGMVYGANNVTGSPFFYNPNQSRR